jgi:hypothetical protein
METHYGVYRVLKNGQHRYVSRSATANKKLAEEIAADLTRGEIVTSTGAVKHVKAYPHVARVIETTTAKKNPSGKVSLGKTHDKGFTLIKDGKEYAATYEPTYGYQGFGKKKRRVTYPNGSIRVDLGGGRSFVAFGLAEAKTRLEHSHKGLTDAEKKSLERKATRVKKNPRKSNARNFPYVVQSSKDGRKWIDESGANTYGEAMDGEQELIGEGKKARIITVEYGKRGKPVAKLKRNPILPAKNFVIWAQANGKQYYFDGEGFSSAQSKAEKFSSVVAAQRKLDWLQSRSPASVRTLGVMPL